MSIEKKSHKIEIRQKEGSDGIMTGANTEIFLDGKRLKLVTGVRFGVDARGVAKVSLDLIADVAIVGEIGNLEETFIPLKPVKEAQNG